MATKNDETWERQESESAPAFAAFVHYRDLGPKRSLLKAYQQHKPDAEMLSGIWSEWSAKWRWLERALAYDDHLDVLRRKARENRLLELEARRIDFEIATQAANEQWVTDLDSEIRGALTEGYTDVEEELIKDAETGEMKVIRRKTKRKFPPLGSAARLLDTRNESFRIAVEGPRTKDAPTSATPGGASGLPGGPATFIWVKPPSTDEEPPTK